MKMMVYPNIKDPVEVPEGTPSGTLFVCVDNTFGKGIVDSMTKKPVSIEDCARGYWTRANLAAAHADQCDWLMARLHGKIEGVWKIDRQKGWMDSSATPKKTWPSDRPKDCPRAGCELISDEEMAQKFIGRDVHLGRCPNTLRGYFKM